MITGEIVLSFVLLVGAGLFLRSFDRLLNVPRGFESDGILTASINLPVSRYPDSIAQIAFFNQLEERIAAIPGVTSVATAGNLPVAGGPDGSIGIEGRTYEPAKGPHAVKRYVSPTFFRTIESRILAGRDFSPSDKLGSLKVAVVNEAFAKRYYPGESAVGKRIDFSWETTGLQTIVGVVRNVKEQSLAATTEPAVYLPSTQRTSSFMYLVVRASVDELSLVPAVRRELRELDPSIPLDDVRRLDAVIDSDLASPRLMASLLTIFAVTAALLAAIGLYGVISYAVSERSQELGIRTALGAQRTEIVFGVLREAFAFVVVGLVVGAIVARAGAQLISSQLFGVAAGDPSVYVVVMVLLLIVALAAVLELAIRASRTDPALALRSD